MSMLDHFDNGGRSDAGGSASAKGWKSSREKLPQQWGAARGTIKAIGAFMIFPLLFAAIVVFRVWMWLPRG